MQRNQINKSTPKKSNIPEDILDDPVIQAFRDFDKNDDGKITNQEFKYILTHVGDNKFSEKEAEELFKECELNEDGELQYEDFVLLWKKRIEEYLN